ncbi:MAG: hypothetical protein LBL87_06590 [Ruminococcus sp.]|nr:hypothetical protein [Ruminococcus sp.]
MKKIISTALLLLLAGCSFGGPIDNMLSPPRLSKEETAVIEALEAAIGFDYRLVYPRAGERRSAVIIENIDSDTEKEAIAFYKPSDTSNTAADVHVNIIDKNADGAWVSVYDHTGDGTEIDRVLINRIGDSKVPFLVLGFTDVSGNKSARVYSFSDNRLSDSLTGNYVTMFIKDVLQDGSNELCIITPNAQTAAAAKLISISGSVIYEWGQAPLNPDATDFSNIVSGYVSSTTPALFIDGLAAGELYTDIIYAVGDGQMRNPMYLPQSQLLLKTKRQNGYFSADIDLDGIVEIPTTSLFPGYNSFDENAVWAVNWNALSNYDIVKKYTSYYSLTNGYCFLFPNRWDGVVTAAEDGAETVFMKYSSEPAERTELMRIAVTDNAEDKTAAGWKVINRKDDFVYWIKNSSDTAEPLVLTDTEIKYNFYILV